MALMRRLSALVIALAIGSPALAADRPAGVPAPPASLKQELAPLIKHGGVAIARDGQVQWAYGDGVYVPASVLKLATGLAALELLGPDYRFLTEIYRDANGNLYLRGYGDPGLVSEEWQAIAQELNALGAFAEPVGNIVADESAIEQEPEVDGRGDSLNPYDARPGALVSNFNTVQAQVGRDGRVSPGEPQTPITPLALELTRGLSAGVQRINLSRSPGMGARYSAELATAIFEQAGARVTGHPRVGPVPPSATLLLAHRSTHGVRDAVRGMLEFSNNVVANQLLLTLALERQGALERHGVPAQLEDGVAILREFLAQRVGLGPRDFLLVEGSGLSRSNRIGLLAMVKVVDAFYPWRDLLPSHGSGGVFAKTGTLAGVSSLAGFLPAPEGSRRAFAILLNQPKNTRDDVLRALMQGESGQ
jgi:D-alanyl-D-alanine carboxypeptidase/D-alanyl-D-alanine-endopeptidase (penicillin-binding protein 4)